MIMNIFKSNLQLFQTNHSFNKAATIGPLQDLSCRVPVSLEKFEVKHSTWISESAMSNFLDDHLNIENFQIEPVGTLTNISKHEQIC